LAADTPHPRQELLLLVNGMCHVPAYRVDPYPTQPKLNGMALRIR
jgi:hypothetical protein